MRLIFIHFAFEDRGSAQDLRCYSDIARSLGHEVVVYGPVNQNSTFDYSLDIAEGDAAIFIFEWTTKLQFGDCLDLARLVASVPRRRRVVIDCDGKYNDVIQVHGDYNHTCQEESQNWIAICDSLTDKIFQPTLHPLRSNVGTFFFHAYNPGWARQLNPYGKKYGMFYVGNNWFRWHPIRRILEALEPIRDQMGRIGLLGYGWDNPPPWANDGVKEEAYARDSEYLDMQGVEVLKPVHYSEVIDRMGQGIFMPVIYRPLFNRLQLVTCRTFETPAANTIPVFCQPVDFVREVFGEAAVELVLTECGAEDKLLDILERPDYYVKVVRAIRARLDAEHSYSTRLSRLIEIVES
jgi:hypothetical protein